MSSVRPAAELPFSHERGELIDSRFRILRLLGRGMSEVYEVLDEQLGERRALKVLPTQQRNHPGHRARLFREANGTRSIDHPNVVHICAAAQPDAAIPYFAMELLEGETLRDHLERHGALDPTRALDLVREAAAGLAAAHERRIFHRDVKPANLFLCRGGSQITGLKVIDFGLARGPEDDAEADQPQTVMGTVEYMAPEQVVADPADARSDVYSLGVVTFRLLTRELPFDSAPAGDLLAHQLTSVAPPPSWIVDQLDEHIDTLILTAVRKNPDNRYPSMEAMLEDIDRVLGGRPPRGVPLRTSPDRYEPRSEMGRNALALLTRRHCARPTPAGA
jgi:serine/threonine-protein kinase